MLQNYLKIAFRNLVKNKTYSGINIGGLAVGMAVAMLIGLWVYDELSFNKYHQNYDRIALAMQNQTVGGELHSSRSVPYPFVNELKTNYAESFKHIVPATHPSESVLAAGEVKVSKVGQFVGADAPELFSLKMLKGSWAGLQEQQSVLLSVSTAEVLFGKSDPMNQLVRIDIDKEVVVTGVYEDPPKNSELHEVRFLASWDYFLAKNTYMAQKQWDNHALLMYVEIKPETDYAKADAAIKDSELNAIKKIDNMKSEVATNPQMFLHPMSNWHLYSQFKNGILDNGPVQYVWLVGLIGFFVLLLACINFMNLSTARSEKRGKEVGIRKAIGSKRIQLIAQFFSESFLVVFIAFFIAVVAVSLSLSWFNNLAAKQMVIPWANAYFWLFSIIFVFITSLLAGSYPALYLTSFQPIRVLKGTMRLGRFSSLPRKILVAVQFTVSITLTICTTVIYSQVQFAKNRPVGYSRDGLMMIEMKSEEFLQKSDIIRSELENSGVVEEMALSQSPATGVWSANKGFTWEGSLLGRDNFATLSVSPEYAKTVGLQFVKGRNFSKDFASDSMGFVINETAAKLFGFQNPIGEAVFWQSKWMTNDLRKQFSILGVVQDMVMESPFEKAKPTVFILMGNPNWINIRLNPNVSVSAALPKIEEIFKKRIPSVPFEYKFTREEYDSKFLAEERTGKLVTFFAILAISISCLGLFGLASFVAEQRTKEIGIRKVLGASVATLWQMLSKDFAFLVVISAIISTPIAWYAMQEWLTKYSYRTEISWWIFALSGIGALVITLLTVSYQAIRAALLNPVKSLRSE
ncbi:ABC transporter permease [Dyadobacter sp. CY312]|uniref:ABC transporter permease n=1 Tax=Dyadobacter sp. CY312 TaxID=2907303 RepID=UPI001F20128C|nr:ABC transporter permease [Dyadobacter sp. CY312]MCE7040637.1 ABC transporter permease [Dyadobacter sp. CY312]